MKTIKRMKLAGGFPRLACAIGVFALNLTTPQLGYAISIRHTFTLTDSAIGSAALVQNRDASWLALSIRDNSIMYFDFDSETGVLSPLHLQLETYTHVATQNSDGSFTINSIMQDYGSLTAEFATASTHNNGFFASGTPGTVDPSAGSGQLISYGNGFGGIPIAPAANGLSFSSLSDANGVFFSLNTPLGQNQWLASIGNMLLGEYGSFVGWTLLQDGRNMDFNFNIRYQGSSSQVPEPGSLLLLASGLTAVCSRRRRPGLS